MTDGLQIFIPEHQTIYEGSRRKTHVINDGGKVLCGASVPLGSGSSDVDMKFLNQPDPDKAMCQSCKKIATKLLNQLNKK